MNSSVEKLLAYYEGHKDEIPHEKIALLKTKISEAASKLKKMSETAYKSGSEAGNRFLTLSYKTNLIAGQILLDKENFNIGEEDFILIDSLESESFDESPDTYFAALAKTMSEFIYIKSPREKIREELASLKHPVFDAKKAEEFAFQMEKEFEGLALSDDGIRQRRIEAVRVCLDHIKGDRFSEKEVHLLSELITLALYPPLTPNGNPFSIISPDQLNKLLESIRNEGSNQLFELLDPRYSREECSLSQKILFLSHLNFSEPKFLEEIRKSPIYQAISQSPSLHHFLINMPIHVPQAYRQTCISTAHTLWIQQKCGTIAEMLFVAKNAVKSIEKKLESLDEEELRSKAYEVTLGTPPTKEAYVKKVLEAVKEKITSLEERALLTGKEASADPASIAQLTRECNFIMQDISTVLNPKNPRVYNYQYLPDFYYLSAIFSSLATPIGTLVPGTAENKDRWKPLSQNELQQLVEVYFGKRKKEYVYRNEWLDPSVAPALEELSPEEMWNKVAEGGGAFLDLTFFPYSGHTMFVAVSYDEKSQEKSYYLFDPMKSAPVKMSAEKFRRFLEKGYEKEKKTSAMYTYKQRGSIIGLQT
ncbi:MAG: hypothetical protein JJU12_05375 [Chlamydiales bacterium]|nr:hypothetical protein [Chlamydiales bacterium]